MQNSIQMGAQGLWHRRRRTEQKHVEQDGFNMLSGKEEMEGKGSFLLEHYDCCTQ